MKIMYRDLRAYKYELQAAYSVKTGIHPVGSMPIRSDYINLELDGEITIAYGYCWDGPSGPAIDSKNFMRGSLVHDALYQLIRLGLLPIEKRAAADRLLYRHLLEDGMSRARAAWVYAAIRTPLAGRACLPRVTDRWVVQEAP